MDVKALGSAAGRDAATAISLNDVWFSYYGKGYALKGIDLTIEKGTSTIILGQSGSGKTTLLKLINGLVKPSKGSVTLAETNGKGPSEARRSIGYIPQQLGLVRNLTALDNVLIGSLPRVDLFSSLSGVFPKEELRRAHGLLETVGIPHKVREKAYRLSGGERQRVAIARALMQAPSIILADEFLSDLDSQRAHEIMKLMQDIRGQGVTLIMVLHNLELAAAYGQKLVVLQDGRKIREGDPSMLSQERLQEVS